MPQWMQDLTAGWPMIRANIPTFIVILVFIFGAVWWLMEWRYGGIVSNRDSEINLIRGQRDDYKDKLSGATPDQAKARIDALEARLASIEPRRLTKERRTELANNLKGGVHSISIVSEMSGDSAQYGTDIAAAFQEAGNWNITTASAVGLGYRPPTGVALSYANAEQPPQAAVLIMSALRKANIHFDIQNKPITSEVEILIATKLAP